MTKCEGRFENPFVGTRRFLGFEGNIEVSSRSVSLIGGSHQVADSVFTTGALFVPHSEATTPSVTSRVVFKNR